MTVKVGDWVVSLVTECDVASGNKYKVIDVGEDWIDVADDAGDGHTLLNEEYEELPETKPETSTNYNDGKWHGWNGGECPVHPETVVEYVYISETVPILDDDAAKHIRWDKKYPHPVIAFRVIKEHLEPREWWALWSPSGNLIGNFSKESAHEKNNTHYNGKGDVIHVREVIE